MNVKNLFSFLFCSTLFIPFHAFACDEGAAEVYTRKDDQKKIFEVCNEGTFGDMTFSQIVEFFSLSKGKMDLDDFAVKISEGSMKNLSDMQRQLYLHAGGWTDHPIELTNKTISGEISESQGVLLDNMAKIWNQVMEIVPSRKEDIFSADTFNDIGSKNRAIVDQLSQSGRQCSEVEPTFAGYPITFGEDDTMVILPISMKRESGVTESRYTIQYFVKDFLRPMSALQERTILMTAGSKKINFLGKDGVTYTFPRKVEEEMSTKKLFSATMGFSSGNRSALCNAEADIDKILAADGFEGLKEKVEVGL